MALTGHSSPLALPAQALFTLSIRCERDLNNSLRVQFTKRKSLDNNQSRRKEIVARSSKLRLLKSREASEGQ